MIAHLRGRVVHSDIFAIIGLLFCLTTVSRTQQTVAPKIVRSADPTRSQAVEFSRVVNSHYYALREKKLGSFTCDVRPVWETVPAAMMLPVTLVGKGQIEAARFKFTTDTRHNLSFEKEYPKDTGAIKSAVYDKFSEWFGSVVKGFFMTWGAKGMGGPLADAYVASSIDETPTGHRIGVNVPEEQMEYVVSKDNLVTEIVTRASGGEIDEHPGFTPSAEGMLLTSMDAVNKQGSDTTHIRYDVDYQQVDGFQLPHRIHLMVNDNMNMRFALEACTATHAVELQLPAGSVSTTQTVTPRTATKATGKE